METQPSSKGPDEYFTGNVRIDPLFEAPDSARAWSECHVRARRSDGMAQTSAGPDPDRYVRVWLDAKRGRPQSGNSTGRRDLVPTNERHWHGATPTTAMTHIAIQEALDGKVVEWMEKVSDEQCQASLGKE